MVNEQIADIMKSALITTQEGVLWRRDIGGWNG
jgi:hypothetical protein